MVVNYPLISEYIEAIKSAEDNFDKLSNLRPVIGADSTPVMSSGNFAVVFKMTDGEKDYAIKCFTREQEGRELAYRQIAEELENVSSSFLCPIRYLDKELFVDTKNSGESEFPVLQMDWVEGVTLDKFVNENLHDKYALEYLAYNFCRMAQWLLTQPFAHGDLKPDNILVQSDGSLVLVDYDGMFVPAMKGEKARELGSPNYRHPLRTEELFDEHIDDFALASIALSLKAIALSPQLYRDFGSADRLLFSEEDVRNLGESKAIAVLQQLMNNPDFIRLYGLFLISHSEQKLSNVSFRLFCIAKPAKPIAVEILSTKVTDEELAEAWEDEFGVKYSKDGKRLLKANTGISSYVIRPGTEVVCELAFSKCSSINKISIPDSMREIGSGAFMGCYTELIINSDRFVSDGVCLFDMKQKKLICCHKKTVKDYCVPKTIKSIDSIAFGECENLQKITLPVSVEEIGMGAFLLCKSLRNISLPNKLTVINQQVFCRCYSLQTIEIPDSVTNIEYEAFGGCTSLQRIRLPKNIINIGEGAFGKCTSLQSITIPYSVQTIGERAFYDCQSLKEMLFLGLVESIGVESLIGCRSLDKILVPNKAYRHYKRLIPIYSNKIETSSDKIAEIR